MAYPPPPAAGRPARDYLADLAKRVEFSQLSAADGAALRAGAALARELGLLGVRAYYAPPPDADAPEEQRQPRVAGLQLHALQAFVANFMVPESPNHRLLLCWETGTGKTIAAITIAQRFAALFHSYKLVAPDERPSVFIIGFTRTVIQAEMLRDPRHGFITHNELAELRRLQDRARNLPAGSPEVRQYHGFVGTLKRALTDRLRGGYYRFFGYKEFASQLLVVTPKGERQGVKVLDLFLRARDEAGPDGAGGDEDQMSVFARRIAEREKLGLVRVNAELLGQLRRGLIIADEIHNVYNTRDPNMYGVALQFVLDAYPAGDAPRAIFMSATPMSGSPAEVVDLLNLLVPREDRPGGRPLRKADFFRRVGGRLAFLPEALDRVAAHAAGRVSFLSVGMEDYDPTDPVFPERVFAGEEVVAVPGDPGPVPFLKFVVCPLAPVHAEALAAWAAGHGTDLPALPRTSDYCLYDMAFPGPDGPLYSSPAAAPIYAELSRAAPAWLAANKVEVLAGTQASGRGAPVVSGGFLARPALGRYSGKYDAFVRDLHAILDGRRAGKVLAYHDRVQLSGVALLAEVLRHNGFVAADEPPTPATRCTVCGVALRDHGGKGRKPHCDQYAPAQYATVTGAMDASAQERALSRFNHPANLDGHDVRVLLGSQVIIEGLDFKAVRFQCVLSVPLDISTLVQILGRGARRGAHALLPAGERWIETRIYLNGPAEPGGPTPPDRVKLSRNMAEYLLILEGMGALRRPAINGFLAQSQAFADRPPALEGLPFALPLPAAAAAGLPQSAGTYYAYGAVAHDLERVRDAVRALFSRRPVWARDELARALAQPGVVLGQTSDPAKTPPEVVDLALAYMAAPPLALDGGGQQTRSRRTGRRLIEANTQIAGPHGPEFRQVLEVGGADGRAFFLAFPLDDAGRPVVDVETYLRGAPPAAGAPVDLRAYADRNLKAANFEKRLAAFRARSGALPAAFLTEYDSSFHYPLLELIVATLARGGTLDPALAAAHKIYSRFKIYVTRQQLAQAAGYEHLAAAAKTRAPGDPVGYIHEDAAKVYVAEGGRGAKPAWQSLPLSAVGRSEHRPENPLIVGYMEVRGTSLRFKVREPRQLLEKRAVRDVRSLARGAVCETRPRAAQVALAQRLSRRPAGELGKLSTPQLCELIRGLLLAEEESARAPRNGLTEGVRWFFLFNEKLPAVAPRHI